MEPEFARMLQLLRALQEAHGFDTGISKNADNFDIRVQFPSPGSFPEAVLAQAAELKKLLNVPAETNLVQVLFGKGVFEPGIVAVRTRSLMQILSTLGAGVQIPAEHAAAGEVVHVEPGPLASSFKVYSGKEKPKEAFVAVPYEGHWYWIEREDLSSKKTLAAVTLLMHFLESETGKSAPILTIPAN